MELNHQSTHRSCAYVARPNGDIDDNNDDDDDTNTRPQ